MKVAKTKIQLLKALSTIKKSTKKDHSIALVPTMGALHAGHLSLIKLAKKHAKTVVLSIFVNPTQFNKREDYLKYPNSLKKDLILAKEAGADLVFAPTTKEIYPEWSLSKKDSLFKIKSESALNENLTSTLEGKFRPGHFEGVTTVVSILFNLVRPEIAIFGEKDFQQLLVIKNLIKNAHYPIKIVSAPIFREDDFLALSSRNRRLNSHQLEIANCIPKALILMKLKNRAGIKDTKKLKKIGVDFLKKHGIKKIDYLEIVDENLKILKKVSLKSRIVIACYVGGVRLIDNMSVL